MVGLEENSLSAVVQSATQASSTLADASPTLRNQAIQGLAQALQHHKNDILEANTLDLETSREMAIPPLLLDWLRLTPERIEGMVQTLKAIAYAVDPLSMVADAAIGKAPCHSRRVPLGVVALMYESLPHLAVIAAAMCLKTANSLILRGGSEASRTNEALFQTIQEVLSGVGFPAASVVALQGGQSGSVRDLVTQDGGIQLVIAYGRPMWVSQVSRQATVPILPVSMGNCYLYWAESGTVEVVRDMILDSHCGVPDAVNAIEKVLVYQNHSLALLSRLWDSLRDRGFELRGDEAMRSEAPELLPLEPIEWQQPYLKKVVAFRRIEDSNRAIEFINANSSLHADAIVTDSYSTAQKFLRRVDSATLYVNTSPRFYRCAPDGSTLLGMCNQKSLYRGPISLTTLTTTQKIVQGLF